MKDQEIISMFFYRDENAIVEVQKSYGKLIFSIANGILKNNEDSEECVSDVLRDVWNNIPPKVPENFKAYLSKLARNHAITIYRKRHAEKRIQNETLSSIEELDDVAIDEDLISSITAKDLSKAISSFLSSINETERSLFIRRYWFNDSILDLCEKFHFRESKVKVTLKRIRDKLKQYLKELGYIL